MAAAALQRRIRTWLILARSDGVAAQ